MARYAVGDPAARLQDKDALIVVDGDAPEAAREIWTFGQVDAAVRRAAGALLARGLTPGERVLIRVGDGPEFPIAYFGVIAAGGIAMPLSSKLSAPELSYIAGDAQPRFALLSEDCPEFDHNVERLDALDGDAAEIADTHRDDPALLVYTSGATGRPKGVLHAHRCAWARRMMRAGWHDISENDRVMHAGAFNWTYTLGTGLSDPWSIGATAILNTGTREPEHWPVLARHWRPTVFAAVPGVYRRMLKYGTVGDAFASLRHGLTAGEKLATPIREVWAAETGKPLHEALGMSECSTFISSGPNKPARTDTIGWPQPGRRVAVLKDGTPVPRGTEGILAIHRSDPGMMLGYWNDPARTDEAHADDWFLTGDRVVMEEDGAIRFAGRDDDLMNAQGYRVAPQEVEEVLTAHPAVTECAVAELPVEDGLSIVAAWIVVTDGAAPDEAALRTHCRDHLAAYKIPKQFQFVTALPRTPNGKLQRRALASLVMG